MRNRVAFLDLGHLLTLGIYWVMHTPNASDLLPL